MIIKFTALCESYTLCSSFITGSTQRSNIPSQRQRSLKQGVSESHNKAWYNLSPAPVAFNFKSINHSTNTVLITRGYFLPIRLLVGNVRVCLSVDRETLLSLCSLKWRGESLRNDVERCICVYGDSGRGTRHRWSESKDVVREGGGQRHFFLHKDLAGCVMQHKINMDPAWKSHHQFCTLFRLIWKDPHKGDSWFAWNL